MEIGGKVHTIHTYMGMLSLLHTVVVQYHLIYLHANTVVSRCDYDESWAFSRISDEDVVGNVGCNQRDIVCYCIV